MHRCCYLTLIAAIVLLPQTIQAAEGLKTDDDFPLQGEYVGMLPGQGRVGLQVIALGKGKFDAVLLKGGLPGAGWDRQPKEKFNGQRKDQVATLKSKEHSLTLAAGAATVSDQNGQAIGRLTKIARTSPTMGLAPPSQATVLFNKGKANELADAKVSADGLLEIGATTKMPVGDFRLHVEFKTPYQPTARGQNRGNSGVYIQRRYEVQILDSFGLDGVQNECGSLYRQTAPDVNMALPPLTWQTYDIWFTAAKFDDAGKKSANARITLRHNGVAVHDNREIKDKTGAGQAESGKPLPIHFQNHGNPVQYRNIWIVLGPVQHPAELAAQQAIASANACCDPCTCCRRVGLLRRIFGRR